jgi:hypothetical protein
MHCIGRKSSRTSGVCGAIYASMLKALCNSDNLTKLYFLLSLAFSVSLFGQRQPELSALSDVLWRGVYPHVYAGLLITNW